MDIVGLLHRAGLRTGFRSAGFRRFRATLAAALCLCLATVQHAPAAGTLVAFSNAAPPGTIVVRTSERRLYLILGDGQALRYKVGVGRSDRQWVGRALISGKYLKPNWAPPTLIKREKPGIADIIPSGSPRNPMGAAAMTLSGGEYAIHGTNTPGSVGGFVSYGCIRMFNKDIIDLYSRVQIGTPVVVLP